MSNKIENARLSLELSQVTFDKKKGTYTFLESLDFNEPVQRVLGKAQRAAHFLFNSFPVKVATRLFAFAAEQSAEINPNLVEKASRLTVEMDLVRFTSFWDFMPALGDKQRAHVETAASEYLTEYCGGLDLTSLLLNDGSWAAGQLVKITSPSVTGQIGVVVSALPAGPVTVLMGKQGGTYLLDQLLGCDKNVVVDSAKLPDEFVADLLAQREKFAGQALELAEGAKEKADRLAKKAATAYDALWDYAQKQLAKLYKQEDARWDDAHLDLADWNATHNEDGSPNGKKAPARKGAKKATEAVPATPEAAPAAEAPAPAQDEVKEEKTALTPDESREFKGLVKNLGTALHAGKHKTPKMQEWAAGQRKLVDTAKEAHDLAGLRKQYEAVKAYIANQNG